jgi:hypothetical protein
MIFPIAQKYQPFIRFTCSLEFNQQITAFSIHKELQKQAFTKISVLKEYCLS